MKFRSCFGYPNSPSCRKIKPDIPTYDVSHVTAFSEKDGDYMIVLKRPPILVKPHIPIMTDEERDEIKEELEMYINQFPQSVCINDQNEWRGLQLESFVGCGATAMGFLATTNKNSNNIKVFLRMSSRGSAAPFHRVDAFKNVQSNNPHFDKIYDISRSGVGCQQPCPWKAVSLPDIAGEQEYKDENPKYTRFHQSTVINPHGFAVCPKGTTSNYLIEAQEYLGNCTFRTYLKNKTGSLSDVLIITHIALSALFDLYRYTDRSYKTHGSLQHGDPNFGNLMLTMSPHKYHVGNKSTNIRPIWSDYLENYHSKGSDLVSMIGHFSGVASFFPELHEVYGPIFTMMEHFEKKLTPKEFGITAKDWVMVLTSIEEMLSTVSPETGVRKMSSAITFARRGSANKSYQDHQSLPGFIQGGSTKKKSLTNKRVVSKRKNTAKQ